MVLKLMTCALHRQMVPLPSPSYLVAPDGAVAEQPPPQPNHESVPRTLLRLILDGPYDTPEAEELLDVFVPHLARCVFGNPFLPLTVDPCCLTPIVLALARAAY